MSSTEPTAEDSALPLEEAVHSVSTAVLTAAAADPALSEDLALTLLKRSDLPREAIERLAKNGSAIKSRKVKLALVEHPKTPRHVSIPAARQLFTFDLMQVALTPAVPADVKAVADETLINRLETVTIGERLSLAHRASGRIAGELLCDSDIRVVHAALENPRLTEAGMVKALVRSDAPPALAESVCRDAKWSVRREVRVALLRNHHTPRSYALEFARSLPARVVRETLHGSRLPSDVKHHLLQALQDPK